ncbi:MAG: aldehyde dehydrogenase family protein [Pseudomonadota bacterium]
MPYDDRELTPALSELQNLLGADGFQLTADQRGLMSEDIWARGELAAFVASPSNTEALQKTVALAHRHGLSLNPRGGGMSYTKGYTPDRPGVGSLDLSRMNRIIEVNTDDMYVTAEAGVTWKDLYEALKPLGVRTPFWGPLSGISSTIGGGLSQNNAFFGAGTYGTTGDSVLSVTVVLADGTLIRTGTAGTKGGKPFWRHYGPDLTGLFCGDAGALGYKAEITFRLIPLPEAEDWASFEFPTQDACAEAMKHVGKTGLACEVFGFDPNLTKLRLKRASLLADAKTLKNVVSGQKSLFQGIKEGAKIALAGRGFMEAESWSLHLIVEDATDEAVRTKMARLKAICEQAGGKETENSIPKIIRANPFTPLNNIIGPSGERWVPIHGIVPMSAGPSVWREIKASFDAIQNELDKHNVDTGFLITTLGTTGYLIEPVFLWPDELFAIHEETVETSYLKKTGSLPRNPDATAVVTKAREIVLDIFSKHQAAHFQIGRTYPYKEEREPAGLELLERIKNLVDPEAKVNPGALGLGAPSASMIKIRNPRTGQHDTEIERISPEALKAQVAAHRAAAPQWQSQSTTERCAHLSRFADALARHKSAIADALERDTGRRRIARMEVDGAIGSIRGWIQQAPHLLCTDWVEGRTNPAIKHTGQYVPYTVVGVISPWNFPLTLSMIDTIPALLAGCTVVIKPSEVTPRFAAPLRAAIAEAGLDAVLTLVDGDGSTGSLLTKSVDLVCFTGSVATGRKVAATAAEAMIPAYLELGGKDPLVVLDGSDLEKATDAALRGSVLSTGQACQSIERIYVARQLFEPFVKRLVDKARAVELNWPDIDKGHIGPIIFDQQADILQTHIDDAVAKGARVLSGGSIENHGGGLWLRPTVLTDVNHDMIVMREETFGPILPVMAFDSTDEAISLANDTDFGLSAAVFGPTLEAAEMVGRRINAGAISLNDAALTALFHEAEKNSFGLSGLGPSRMGAAGFQRFTRRKALIAQAGSPAPIDTFREDAE